MTFRYIIYCLFAVVLTFLIHEFSHWTMGELLGYEMVMTLNKVYPISLSYKQDWHYILISAIGPLITLLQAFVFYLLIKKTSRKNLYPFLFTCFYLEFLSGVMNLRNPNDLGRISKTFNLGLLTIPLIFVALHFFMLYKTSISEKYTWKFILFTLLWIIIISSVWIITNQKFNVVII